MRKPVAALAAAALASALIASAVGAQAPPDEDDVGTLVLGGQLVPKSVVEAGASVGKAPAGPNPYLALLPDVSKVDYAAWKAYLDAKGQQRADLRELARANQPLAVSTPIVVDEEEIPGSPGSNDTPATAQPVEGFGTRRSQNNTARILGELSGEPTPTVAFTTAAEDNGAIPLASATGIGTGTRRGITTSSTIGDGPHGRAAGNTGDFDFFALNATAGQTITGLTATPTGPLDTMLFVYDSTGALRAFNDDAVGLDSRVRFVVPTTGTYFVAVSGFNSRPADPFNPASGNGAGSEGPYDLTITAGRADIDVFAVELRAGDVVGNSVSGAAPEITLYDPAEDNVMGSTQDATFIYPSASPLPGGGNAVAEHVADEAGWHYVAVAGGSGSYDITVEGYRPPLDTERPVQTLFLDFDGARINTGIWGGPGVRTLSPLRTFLGRWGLTNADLNPLIDEIIANVQESIEADMIASGVNPEFRIKILNSRDHRDPWGKPNVSRVIVGGTIAESGIDTIGIAQSIDPGNFETEESALVLLDILSDPPFPFGDPSLNSYMTAASDRVAFVGQAVGNVTAHEAGHFFGNFHVDQFNASANLQDQGGNFPLLYGVGPDRIGGTADDVDVDFGEDTFNPNEGFTGTEDTLTRIAMAVRR
jgi:hypothetical protein